MEIVNQRQNRLWTLLDRLTSPFTDGVGSQEGVVERVRFWEMIHVLVMVGVAAWLRVPGLGTLSLYGDEDYTILAVQAILTDGFPHMPSGMGYWRAAAYSYVAAATASLFGTSAFSIRLPSSVFGILTIPIFYSVAKRLAGDAPAALATWLLVFSAWHVDVSREGRMYSMFLASFLSALLCFIKGFWDNRTTLKVVAFVLSAITLTLHHLGSLVVMVWLIPFWTRSHSFKGAMKVTSLVAAMALVGLSAAHNRLVMFDVPGKNLGGAASGLTGLLHLDLAPRWGTLNHLWEHYPFWYIVLVISTGFCTVYLLRRNWPVRREDALRTLGSIVVLVFALLNLIGLIVVTLLVFLLWGGTRSRNVLKDPGLRGIGALAALITVFWWSYGLVGWQGGDVGLPWNEAAKKVIKDSLYFPAFHILVYLSAFPIMTLIVCVGTLIWGLALHQSRTTAGLEAVLFPLFWLPLIALGFKKEWIYLRYTITVYPFFLLIFAYICVLALDWLRGIAADRSRPVRSALSNPLATTACLILLLSVPIFNEEHGIQAAYKTSRLRYQQAISPLWHGFPFHPDHESAGAFVKTHLLTSDLVVAMDVFQQFIHVGRVDYWWTSDDNRRAFGYRNGDKWLDIYTATPILTSQGEFKDLLRRHADKRVWLITSAELSASPVVSDGMARTPLEVFLGQDGDTRVYLFETES